MISYEPKQWYHLLFRWRGTVLPAILPRLGMLGAWTAAVIVADRLTSESWRINPLGHTLMGAVVGFLIVLRTNTAYERFWEARKLWGGMVNSSRNLIRQAAAFAPPARELAEMNIAYVLALKQFLRRSTDYSEVQKWLSPAVFEKATGSENPPLELAYEMGVWGRRRVADGRLDAILAMHIDDRVREMIDLQGACERILKTPIPFNYAVHIKQFLTIYLLSLPCVFVEAMGWVTLPVVLLVGFALGGIEEAGVEVEDPFGTEPNDLPLEGICSTIERDVLRLAALSEPPKTE